MGDHLTSWNETTTLVFRIIGTGVPGVVELSPTGSASEQWVTSELSQESGGEI